VRLKLGLISIILLVGGAFASPRITTDLSGNILQSWLDGKSIKTARSLDLGSSFSQPESLGISAEAYDLTSDPSALKYYLVFQTSREVFLSIGNNLNFSQTRLLARDGESPKIITSGGTLFSAWKKNDTLYLASSSDQGETWLEPELIPATGEAIGDFALASSGDNNCDLVFTAMSRSRYSLYFYRRENKSLVKITNGFDPITLAMIAPGPFGPLILWQQRYLDRSESFAIVSIDGGSSFSPIIKLELPEQPARLSWDGEKWRSTAFGKGSPPLAVSSLVLFPAPAQNSGVFQATTVNSSLEILTMAKPDQSIWTLEISPDQDFFPPRTIFSHKIVPAGANKQIFPLPGNLQDGNYWARVTVNDGQTSTLVNSSASFSLDRTPPIITILTSRETIDNTYQLQGKVNEPGILSIDGQKLAVHSSGTFEARLSLKPGANSFILTTTDEAGNIAKNTLTINYTLPTTLQLKLVKPAPTDWLKPGSIVYCELLVTDPRSEVEDESEAEVKINGKLLNETLYYEKSEQKLSGLITIPDQISDGIAALTIKLPAMEKQLDIKIDSTPPTLTTTGGATVFGNTPFAVPLPLSDGGSGLDPAGTIVMINGISCETYSSGEALTARLAFPLSDGTFEVTTRPRDLVGNISPQMSFLYCLDTIDPSLAIAATPEVTERQTIVVNGTVSDKNLLTVVITRNGKEVHSFFPNQSFSKEVPILPGNNTIVVEGRDKAGNLSSQTISFSSAVHASGALLSDVGNAPNPFSPRLDGQTYFICRLAPGISLPADIRIHIFNLTGELIWKKEFIGSGANVFAWDGRDHFGSLAANGVYLYTIGIFSWGRNESMRGKLIIYQ